MTTRIKTGDATLRKTKKSPPKLSVKSNWEKNKIGYSLELICGVPRFMFWIKFLSKIQLTIVYQDTHTREQLRNVHNLVYVHYTRNVRAE